mgnify:CR=1 FL=1
MRVIFLVASFALAVSFLLAAPTVNNSNETKDGDDIEIETPDAQFTEHIWATNSFSSDGGTDGTCGSCNAPETKMELKPEALSCSICCCEITADGFKTRCKHNYHQECVFPWIDAHGTCPYCRGPISTEQDMEYFIAFKKMISPIINEPTDNMGRRPIHLVCKVGHLDVLNWLIKFGADVNVRNIDGMAPIHLACGHGHLNVLDKLIDAGAMVNIVNNEGEGPIHIASMSGNLAVLNRLIEADAKIDLVDNNGQAPIHLACLNGHLEIVNKLIEAQANLNIEDIRGLRPFDVARRYGKILKFWDRGAANTARLERLFEIEDRLLKAVAKTNIVDPRSGEDID